ncbi:MAG: ImuA family protein [Rhodobacterales bacterium]
MSIPANPALLTRAPHRDRPALLLADDIRLTLARLHEACGPARRSFAIWLAGHVQRKGPGPVIWIAPRHLPDRPHPDGVVGLARPEGFIHITPQRPDDLLWCMEEALRSGAAPLVVADLPGPPGLTPVRRLHLAAETGAAEGTCAPLGLILTPEQGGASGVETRWHMAPAHSADRQGWNLRRLRARQDPPKDWHLTGPEHAATGPIHAGGKRSI